MKFSVFVLALTVVLSSCSPQPNPKSDPKPNPPQNALSFPEKAAPLTIYEVNIRQHTAEGTFNAFIEDLPNLQELGVGILWIMPIQKIGEKERKGPLGSYYAVADYKEVNQEFGTSEDFQRLVDSAHEMGMYVILDWVPNHTAWDHPWITSNPEYYTQNEKGEIIYEADWTDIALLDHTNPDTRKAMIADMKFWVDEYGIDGFRQDHAGHEIPLYFWEEATEAVDPEDELLWLAEWDGARMHLEFDATYAWELLHISNEVAKGEKTAQEMAEWIDKDIKEYGRKALRMTMITNHDENAWTGTVFERYGEGHQAFVTFIFTAYGIPMIYSGQEVGLDKRLKFFEKDTIDWSDPLELRPFYKKLVQLKRDNPALWAGEFGAMPEWIGDNENVIAFKRSQNDNTVIGLINLTRDEQQVTIDDASINGTQKDYFTGESVEINSQTALDLEPWQFLIFVKG
ncbi:MAG: alpha-amylase family glycosyl hydrolase [Cyclobacteriaceae bacterium]